MTTQTTNAEEDFEFASIPRRNMVNVANREHGDEQVHEHTYTVFTDEEGNAIRCTCLGWHYTDWCKHCEGVEETNVRPADCCCDSFSGLTDLPCWPCFRDGYETPATEAAQ
jgi:hypothetical protein